MFFDIFFFILGVIIGSFLNVAILRYNTGLTLRGRSRCFSCGKTLAWTELIPLWSFIFQRGKCKNCKSAISFQYPLVELATGLVFLGIFYKSYSFLPFPSIDFFSYTAYFMIVFSILIIIAVYDLRHKIIPDGLVFAFIILSFLKALFHVLSFPFTLASYATLFAGLIVSFPFFAIWFFSQGKWMGFGDVKLSLGIGWLLGIAGGFSAVIFAFYTGAVIGLSLIIVQKCLEIRNIRSRGRLSHSAKNLTMKSEIPFGPFLILGVFAVFFFGIDFLSFYLTLR